MATAAADVAPGDAARIFYWRDDATRWVWVCYGLAQAVITMLAAFDVITTFTAAEVVTAITLVAYVAVNELLVRPKRRRAARRDAAEEAPPPPG